MTQHIIDTDEIEKLPKQFGGSGKALIALDDLRAFIANSPQVDGMVLATQVLCALLSNPARYEHIRQQVESGKLTQEQATQKNINKAKLIAEAMLSAYKPQADDVRKDAERMDYLCNPDKTYRVLVQSQPSGNYVFDSCIVTNLREAIDKARE